MDEDRHNEGQPKPQRSVMCTKTTLHCISHVPTCPSRCFWSNPPYLLRNASCTVMATGNKKVNTVRITTGSVQLVACDNNIIWMSNQTTDRQTKETHQPTNQPNQPLNQLNQTKPTTCSWALREKLTVPQLVKKCHTFYENRNFTTVFTTARQLSPTSDRPIQSMPPSYFLTIHWNILQPKPTSY
jgi:hypothetical protein